MLKSLEIKNFKGIKEGTISDLAQVNVLVGRNNSGKSTVLDALLLMRYVFVITDYLGNDGLEWTIKRRVERGNVNYRELHYMLNTQEPIYLQAAFTDGAKVVQQWGVVSRQLNLSSDVGGNTKGHGTVQMDPSWIRTPENFRSSSQFENVASHIGYDNATLIALGHLLDPSTIRFPFLERFWEKIVLDRRDRVLRDMINGIHKLNIEGFSLMPFAGHNRLVALLPDRSVAVDWLGDGLRYALNILALGMLLEGTILMVEEPETHQHPESLKLLTRTLFELARRQNLQLFLTTHSWELMTYSLEAAEQTGVELAMHHVRLNDKGMFDTRSIPLPDAKLLLDIGHDIRLSDKYIGAR